VLASWHLSAVRLHRCLKTIMLSSSLHDLFYSDENFGDPNGEPWPLVVLVPMVDPIPRFTLLLYGSRGDDGKEMVS